MYSSGLQAELVTPTGAAIVKTLAKRFGSFPAMKSRSRVWSRIADFPGHRECPAVTVGESDRGLAREHPVESVTVLEANLDDLNPQVFGYVMDRLLEEGALDVFAVPVQMKKNRPGTLLTVLCQPDDADKLDVSYLCRNHYLGRTPHGKNNGRFWRGAG